MTKDEGRAELLNLMARHNVFFGREFDDRKSLAWMCVATHHVAIGHWYNNYRYKWGFGILTDLVEPMFDGVMFKTAEEALQKVYEWADRYGYKVHHYRPDGMQID